MVSDKANFFKYRQVNFVKLECSIDLDKLFPNGGERFKFEKNWKAFLESDPNNKKVFRLEKHRLVYFSEQLVPKKVDSRPPLSMTAEVLGENRTGL